MAIRPRQFAILASILLPLGALADIAPEFVEGVWLSADGTGWIKIELSDKGLLGSIAGSPDETGDRQPSDTDVLNPDPALRDRLLLWD
jgi:hypothetical protein